MNEGKEQELLFSWAEGYEIVYPSLRLMHHIPNGGKRDTVTGAVLRRQGVKAGVPDICLPVARGKYHGLYIELKVGENRPSPAQRAFIDALRYEGYAVAVCYGWRSARDQILRYMKQEDA